jgi:hypothetical protein
MVSVQGVAFASWGPDEAIIASLGPGRPLVQWSAAGGAVNALRELETGVSTRVAPSWLPGDLGYLYMTGVGTGQYSIQHVRGDRAAKIAGFESAGPFTVHYRTGHLLLAATENSNRTVLTAQPFNPVTDQLSGRSSVLVTDLNPAFSASDTGVLVYAEGLVVNERLLWLDERGELSASASEPLRINNFDLSPNERLLVVQGGTSGLFLHDLERKATSRLSDRGNDPVWSSDGSQIAFAVQDPADRGIHVMPAFGGTSRRVYAAKQPTYLDDWSVDGKWLAGHVNISGPGILIPQAEGATPILLEEGQAGVDETRFSPDGKWLAYGLNASGVGDVYLVAVPPTGERWKVSVNGGAQPHWRADGKALYYLSLSGVLMMVDIDAKSGAPPTIGAPRELFQTGIQVATGVDQYAVSRDGKRFLIRRADEAAGDDQNQIHVIVNWPGLLGR